MQIKASKVVVKLNKTDERVLRNAKELMSQLAPHDDDASVVHAKLSAILDKYGSKQQEEQSHADDK